MIIKDTKIQTMTKMLQMLGIIKAIDAKKDEVILNVENVNEWLDSKKIKGKATTEKQNRIIKAFLLDSLFHLTLKETEKFTKGDVEFCKIIFKRCTDEKFAVWFFGTFAESLAQALMKKSSAERMAENGKY